MLNQHVAFGVEARVALRQFLDDAHERHGEERQIGESRASLSAACVEMLAQPLELRDVDFLDVREVRDVALGIRDALRADAAHAEDADLFGFRARLDLSEAGRVGVRAWPRLRLEHGVEILSLNAAIAARACDGCEIDACFPRASARRRRRHHTS